MNEKSSLDAVRNIFVNKMKSLSQVHSSSLSTVQTVQTTDNNNKYATMFKNIEWALPTRSNFRYTNKQKQVLFKYFMEGEESGNKMSPEGVILLRKKLLPEEYVSVQQIRSLFSRWSKLYREGKLRPPSDEEDYETGKHDNIDHDDDWDAEQYKIDLNNVTSKEQFQK